MSTPLGHASCMRWLGGADRHCRRPTSQVTTPLTTPAAAPSAVHVKTTDVWSSPTLAPLNTSPMSRPAPVPTTPWMAMILAAERSARDGYSGPETFDSHVRGGALQACPATTTDGGGGPTRCAWATTCDGVITSRASPTSHDAKTVGWYRAISTVRHGNWRHQRIARQLRAQTPRASQPPAQPADAGRRTNGTYSLLGHARQLHVLARRSRSSSVNPCGRPAPAGPPGENPPGTVDTRLAATG